MSPLGKGESVGKYVARSLDIIDKSGVDYRLNPMGTVLEGEWDEVFAVVKKCYERMKKDCGRISCTIKVDYRKGPRRAFAEQGCERREKTQASDQALAGCCKSRRSVTHPAQPWCRQDALSLESELLDLALLRSSLRQLCIVLPMTIQSLA